MIVETSWRPLELASVPKRIVSLVPSITETLFALGVGQRLVGITSFCIFPTDGVDRLPRVGGTKNPSIDAIRQLAPDLVYMNLEENLRRHGETIESFAPVHVSEPKTVDDVRELILQMGSIHEQPAAAATMADELDRQLQACREQAQPFTFACPIWKDPWMWCGGDTYVSNLIVACGGENVVGDRTRYPTIPLDELLDRRPDMIFLPDEPMAFSVADGETIRSKSAATVVGPFPGHLVTWHGVRTTLGLRFLDEQLRLRRNR